MMSSKKSSKSVLPIHVSEDLERLLPHQVDEASSLLVDAFLNDSNDGNPSPLFAWILEDLLLDDQRTTGSPIASQRRRQREALHWLFCRNIEAQLGFDASRNRETSCRCVFLRQPGQPPKMICFFILSTHETKADSCNFLCSGNIGSGNVGSTIGKIPWWSMISRHGILRFPLLFGWKTFYRLLISNKFYLSFDEKYLISSQEDLESFTTFSVNPYPYGNVCLSYHLLQWIAVEPSMQGKNIGSFFLLKALYGEEQQESQDIDATAATMGDYTTILRNKECVCLLQTGGRRSVAFFSRLGFTTLEEHDFETRVTSWLMGISSSSAMENMFKGW